MKIKFNLDLKVEKKKTVKQAKMVLFQSMIKMHELAVMNCPVDTSRLINSIKVFPMSPGFMKYILIAPVEYAEAVEFGTDPHVIKVKNKKVLANKKKGQIFGTKVMHPGTEAQPYFRPALSQVKNVWIKRYWKKNLVK